MRKLDGQMPYGVSGTPIKAAFYIGPGIRTDNLQSTKQSVRDRHHGHVRRLGQA